MNRFLPLAIALAAIWSMSTTALAAGLKVAATTADLSAIAAAVGGKHVDVTAMAKPTEDPHFVDPKPSFIVRLNRADALIEGGVGLEQGWLPALIQGARNSALTQGAPGRILAAQGIPMLEVPSTLDRAQGDVHAAGNPHFLMNPANAQRVAENIAAGFKRLDPQHAEDYDRNYKVFARDLDKKIAEWKKKLEPFAGQQLVAYHNTWPYFAQHFNLEIQLFLEPKPGIPPSPAHLAESIARIKADQIKVIIIEPYHHLRTAQAVADATGAKVVTLTQYPGGIEGTGNGYIEMMDYNVNTLADALGSR